MANLLVPNSNAFNSFFPCVNNMEFALNIFLSKMNICLILFPFVINLP
jgi:hypothetical protein